MHCREKMNTILYSGVSVWQNNRTTLFCVVASAKSDKQLQENTLMYKSWYMCNRRKFELFGQRPEQRNPLELNPWMWLVCLAVDTVYLQL